jgi:hypothetical protein
MRSRSAASSLSRPTIQVSNPQLQHVAKHPCSFYARLTQIRPLPSVRSCLGDLGTCLPVHLSQPKLVAASTVLCATLTIILRVCPLCFNPQENADKLQMGE